MNNVSTFRALCKGIRAFRFEMQIDTNQFVDDGTKEQLEAVLSDIFNTAVFVETFHPGKRQQIREAITQSDVNNYLRQHNVAVADIQQQLYYFGFQSGHLLGTFETGIHKDDVENINKLLTTALGAPVSVIPQSQYQLDFEPPQSPTRKIKVMDIMASIFIFAIGFAFFKGAPVDDLFAGGLLVGIYWGWMALMHWIFKLGR